MTTFAHSLAKYSANVCTYKPIGFTVAAVCDWHLFEARTAMLHACVLVESRSETRSTRRKTRGPHAQKHDTSGNPTRERKQRLACWNLIFCPLARSGTLADVSPRGSVVSKALLPTSWLCYSRGNMRACLLLILWVPSLQEGCNAWLHSISAYA